MSYMLWNVKSLSDERNLRHAVPRLFVAWNLKIDFTSRLLILISATASARALLQVPLLPLPYALAIFLSTPQESSIGVDCLPNEMDIPSMVTR